jgi:hypothetical protein
LSLQQAYKDISRELLPNVLFPSTDEYRGALEKYLESHASKYIESIGNNNWLSMFEVKLLPEVSEMLD